MECFKIMNNEIEGRIDPFYYRVEFRKLEKKLSKIKLVPFGKIIKSIINGFDYRKFSEDGLTYLRVSNIKPFEFDLTDVKKINPNFSINKKIELKKGNLLLTRKGTFGVALSIDKDEDYIISSEIFKIELLEGVHPKFIEIILNSPIAQSQFNKHKVGGIMGSLSQEAVKQIKIPLPSLEVQNHIVELMEKAYSSKESKESQAQKLLDSINDYVLDELGIKSPKLKDKMTYVAYSDEIKGKRIDPYCYQPKFNEIEKAIKNGKFELVKLNDVVIASANEKIIRKDSEKYVYVEIGDLDKTFANINLKEEELGKNLPKGPKKKLLKNDVIVSTVRPYLKGIAIINEDIENLISTSAFCILRADTKVLNPNYLLGFVRNELFINLICRKMTGTTYPTVAEEDILSLEIPLPPFSVQNKIAEEVKSRIQQAKHLQKEAKEELEKAKAEVERMLLDE